jgi:hypothetical protein
MVSAEADDVIHLKPAGSVRGNITSIDETMIRVRVTIAGAGSSVQSIPMARVKLIDFGPITGETELLSDGDATAAKEELTELWAQKRPFLGYPRSNAGEVGLLLGRALLASNNPTDHGNARNLYTIIERGDWDTKRRAEAKRGRLEALVKTGAAGEVLAEAKTIAEEGGDPKLLLAAEYVLATSDLERLRELVAENPKWREDDHVRPELESLYHDLLDRFLKPLLFYGTEQEAATDGLLAAGEVYFLIGKPDRARECFEDIGLLYPKSDARFEAEAFLKRLSPDKDDEEKNDPEN